MVRDRKIYRILRASKWQSENRHRLFRQQIEPLSVYAGKPGHPRSADLTIFPVTHQRENGRPMPSWKDLTPWLKTQLLVMALHEWGLQTFTINVARDLEAEWMAKGLDPRKELRERMRKHMGRAMAGKSEHFFVVEGWSKKTKAPTRLHLHGGAFIREPGDSEKIIIAAAKAGGQMLYDRKHEPRSVHEKIYWRDGPRYVNYLFKSVRKPDARLERQRLVMTREATGAGREFWELLTEPR